MVICLTDAHATFLLGVKYFLKLDLHSGYWQVEMKENDKKTGWPFASEILLLHSNCLWEVVWGARFERLPQYFKTIFYFIFLSPLIIIIHSWMLF